MSKYHLWPNSSQQELNIYLNGFRNIGVKKHIKVMSCVVRVHGIVTKFKEKMEQRPKHRLTLEETIIKLSTKVPVEKNRMKKSLKVTKRHKRLGELELILEDDLQTIKIDRVINLQIQAANMLELAPVMEVFLYKGKGKGRELLSVGNIKLDKALAYYYGLEDNQDYNARFRDFMKLGDTKEWGEEVEEGPHVRPKMPRVRPQNKMNIFGVQYLVEMPEPKGGLAEEKKGHGIVVRREGQVELDELGREVQMREEFDMQNEVAQNVTIEIVESGIVSRQVEFVSGIENEKNQIREFKETTPSWNLHDGENLEFILSYRSVHFSYYLSGLNDNIEVWAARSLLIFKYRFLTLII